MKQPYAMVMIGLLLWWSAGCMALSPGPRLDQYVGSAAPAASDSKNTSLSQGGVLNAGLIVIHDATGNRADESVLEHSRKFLTDQSHRLIESRLPIRLVSVLEPPQVAHSWKALELWHRQLREQRLTYALVALFSNDQTDTPDTLLMDGSQEGGGAMGRILGVTTTDFALAELAFLELTDRGLQVVARAEGRDSATLERLANGFETNAYPSIRRSGRIARIVPPSDEAMAKDMLRGLASSDALERAITHLEAQWKSGVGR
ncbi:MAG: hypothetical protein ABL970_09805 [Nitrospira sp.]